MTRLEVAVHDLAVLMAGLPTDMPNRLATFELSLGALCNYAISEYATQGIKSVRADVERVDKILRDSKHY